MRIILYLSFIVVFLFSSSSFADSRLDNCLQYKEQIVNLLIESDISHDYFYLAVCESGCKIKTSSKGARGFFQIIYPTYKHYKPEDCSIDDIDDIRCNTLAAANYIKHLQKRFKEMKILIKAYNRGGTNYLRKGTTKEANGLSYCVMNYIKQSNKSTN